MSQLDPTLLGVILVVFGLSAALLILLLLQKFSQSRTQFKATPNTPTPVEDSDPSQAILIVQPGGRISYISRQAREWFDAWEEVPSLERLSRKITPTNPFIELCVAQGERQFHLDGRLVHVLSYSIPYGDHRATFLAFHSSQLFAGKNGDPFAGSSGLVTIPAIQVLNQLGQAMATSLDFDITITAILKNAGNLIPADFAEITTCDRQSQRLTTYHLLGADGDNPELEKSNVADVRQRPFTGTILAQKEPLLVNDLVTSHTGPVINSSGGVPILSFLGAPLIAAGELVGTLELGSLSINAYTQNDLENVQIYCGPAAIALNNALLYTQEQQRGKELAGLAQLAQVVGTAGEPSNLFSHLVESIAPLLEVEFLGFLIYDDNRCAIQGQLPFLGLHPDVIEWTSAIIQVDSPAEKIWLSQEPIVAPDATSDPKMQSFGFDNLAQATGIHQAVLMPLTSAGRMLGYLMAGDKLDRSPFNQDDLRLLAIIASQAAPIVENAELIQQSEKRAQRAETLRRIASLTVSSATLDETLKYALQDLGRLLRADKVGVLLLDESRGELRLHKSSLFGISPEFASRMGRISTENAQFNLSVTRSQTYLISDDITHDQRLPAVYHPILYSLGLKSVVIAPLVVQDHGIGEIIIGSYQPAFFSPGDIQTVVTACGQLANVVERSVLYTQTDESLRRRVDQLTALTRLSRDLNTNPDLEYLAQRVFEELLQTTGADCGTITLFDTTGEAPAPTENGHPPQLTVLFQLGDRTGAEFTHLEKQVLSTSETLVIDDYEQHNSTQPEEEAVSPVSHAGVCSSMIVPITCQDKITGLIHLHANTPHRFDQAAVEISEALALQSAVALSNVYRYQKQVQQDDLLHRRVDALGKLLEAAPALRADQSLDEALNRIAHAIQSSTPFNSVLVSVFDTENEQLYRVASAGVPGEVMEKIKNQAQPWESILPLLRPEFMLGRCYFIPHEKMPVKPADVRVINLLESNPRGELRSTLAWHPEDLLLIPLADSESKPLGLISVDDPRDHLRPDITTVASLEIFATQATLIISGNQQMAELKGRLLEMEADLNRAEQSAQSSQNYLPILLRKDLEQTIAVQHLSQRATRIRAGMDIAEVVNRQGDRSSVLSVFGREILTRMDMDIALIVEPSLHGPHLLNSLGNVPSDINIEALIGQRNPLHQTLQNGNILLASRLEDDPEWSSSPLLQALDACGFICIPIFIGARLDAAVLAINQTPLAPFTSDDEHLFSLLSRLVAITLQNLNLLLEISQHLAEVNLLLDFNRQLSNLESNRILETLVESALHVIPTAQACLVATWDLKRELLVPQAASGYADKDKIMEICYHRGEALPGKSLAYRQAIRVEDVDFPSLYNLSSENLLRYHDATDGRLPLASMVVPIQKSPSAEPLGVLVLENFKNPEAFSSEAQALVTSLTQQTALNLENSRLYRAAELRATQLQALTGVAAIISSNLQPEELIASLLDQLEAILPFQTGTLWLREGDQMFVRMARGFADSDERIGLSISVEDSKLLGEMIATCQPIVVGDVTSDSRFPALVENPNLSWLGLPLVAGGGVIGVIALEMDEANFYTTEHVQIASAFAGQAAVALENANLYQQIVARATELDQRSQRLEALNRFSAQVSGSLDPDHLLQTTLHEILNIVHCSSVSAILFDSSERPTLQAELPSRDSFAPLALSEAPLFERLRQTLGSYICDDIASDEELAPISDYFKNKGSHSLMALSLATGSDLHGVLMVEIDHPHHYSADEIGLTRTLSNQAAIAIQNARLYAETRSLTNELDQRVKQRTDELERAHQRTETLLRLITELSASLDLEQVLTRTLKVLNQIIDAEHITVLLARTGERKLHHLASVGYQTPLTTDEFFTSLNPDQGLAGWIIQQRKPALIPDVKEDPRWVQLPNSTVEYRSAIGVPLLIGGVSLGALLFFHRKLNHFSMDQLDLVQAAANQVAIAVNNAELYRLIRDQAEDLGNMVRSQQIETQRTKAMLEDVADGVLVTDETMKITLFNDSAEHVLGLQRENVIGKSLDHFIGLFGRAAQTWMDTIRTWSQDPDSYRSGDTYAEQVTLDDGRVVSVHLAPVSLRETFLGTVSIFRDITHQVEVDRLKSEFVATVSHELRTPMTSIKGYVDILLMGAAGALNEQQTHFLEIVRNNSERLAILVNDLLDISRIESGRLTFSLQPFDLAPIARDAVAALTRRTQEDHKSMRIETDLPRNLPRVLGDPEQIRRVLDNLLENAYYYTGENGQILLRIRKVSDHLQVDVKDTGIGIPPELQPRVFERFYRGEHPFVLATSGTGLGLSIVKHLVDMHNGQIWLESSGVSGEGSTFSFTIPMHTPDG